MGGRVRAYALKSKKTASLDFHFVQERVAIRFINSVDQIVDGFTKPLIATRSL